MAAIPGYIYLIIGGGMAILSRYFEKKGINTYFFFWASIAFIVIGIFKTLIWYITRKSKTKAKKEINDRPVLKPVKLQRQIVKKPEYRYDPSQYPKYCPQCKLLYPQTSNFCSKCGHQLYIKP